MRKWEGIVSRALNPAETEKGAILNAGKRTYAITNEAGFSNYKMSRMWQRMRAGGIHTRPELV